MTTSGLFQEYIWIINTLRREKKLSLEELNKKWLLCALSDGKTFSRFSFIRYKKDIEDNFGIIIQCDRHCGNKYYIENVDSLQDETIQNWMVSTLSVSNIISESINLQDRIIFENCHVDEIMLSTVIEGMKQNKYITFQYQKYTASEAREFTLAPYCIKFFKHRWYLLTRFKNGNYGIFAFDRIKSIVISEEAFTIDPNFNAKAFFADCYGIVIGDGSKAQRIVIRAYETQQANLKDLPLHHTQKEIAQGENYTDFEYYMRPTKDLQGHIMSMGNMLQVLEPQSLANDIKDNLKKALERY